ncbi:MAG: SUMF1/EgtB/PvdO family nonheme iron enzyme [Crenarchaeota archaeon]|jgi:hypothetical protein|nr:SUMF1/EgtB/PvdO family nonheme iron enzyme [Thermoproteota archaeon]
MKDIEIYKHLQHAIKANKFVVKIMVVKYFCIIVLLCTGLHYSFAQKKEKPIVYKTAPVYCVGLENNESSILSVEENVHAYIRIMKFVKSKYGKESQQYRSLIPDTAKFRSFYGFSFFQDENVPLKTLKSHIKKLNSIPMVAISYEQAVAYCQWYEIFLNELNHQYEYQLSLPTKEDYEKALKIAKITRQQSLSTLKSKNRIMGLTDNVAEYTRDGVVIEGCCQNTALKLTETEKCDNPIGFRYISKMVLKTVCKENNTK